MYGSSDNLYDLSTARQAGAPQRFAGSAARPFGNYLKDQQRAKSGILNAYLQGETDTKVAETVGQLQSSPSERSSHRDALGGVAAGIGSLLGRGSGSSFESSVPWNFNTGLNFLGGSSGMPSSFSSGAGLSGPDFNAGLARSVSFDFLK